MRPFGPFSIVVGAVVASALAYRGMKRKSLSPSGAFSAWFVGFLSLASGLRGMVLFQFYIFGTAATKYRHAEKTKKDASAQDGSIRGPSQVLACSIVAVGCSLVHTYYCGEEKEIDFALYPLASSLTCGVIAHYATCLADTLASELGILAAHDPILVTMPWKKVPPGINGGITMAGTMWSGIGGGLMGLGTVAMGLPAMTSTAVLTIHASLASAASTSQRQTLVSRVDNALSATAAMEQFASMTMGA